jgi:hypothetical protein
MQPKRRTKSEGTNPIQQFDEYLSILKRFGIPTSDSDTLEAVGPSPFILIFNTTLNKLRIYDGTIWKDAVPADLTNYYTKIEIDSLFTTQINGLKLEVNQLTSEVYLKDSEDNILSTINVGFLNNEGTSFVYNEIDNTLELYNDSEELLTSIPVSSFVTNSVSQIIFNTTTPTILEIKDVNNVVISSVQITISNIDGLQTALNNLEPLITILPVSKGGTGKNTITENSFYVGGPANTLTEKTIEEVFSMLISAGNGLDVDGPNNIYVISANSGRITVNPTGIDLAQVAVTPGTYYKVTIDEYGRVVGTSNINISDFSAILNSIHNLTDNGFIVKNGTNTVSRIITGTSGRIVVSNQTGVDGNPQIDLSPVGVTPGTYNSVTVDNYGRVTSASNIETGIKFVPNTIFVDSTTGSDITGEIERPDKPFQTITKALEVRNSVSSDGSLDKNYLIKLMNAGNYQITKGLTSSATSETNIKISSLLIYSDFGATVTITKNFNIGYVDLIGINLTINLESGVTLQNFNGGNLQIGTLTITAISPNYGLRTWGSYKNYIIDHFIGNAYSAIANTGGDSSIGPAIIKKFTNNSTLFHASYETSRLQFVKNENVQVLEIVNSVNAALNIQQTWTSSERISTIKLKKITNPGGNIVNFTFNSSNTPNSMRVFLDLDNGYFENFYINAPYWEQPSRISGRCSINYLTSPTKSFITVDRSTKSKTNFGESYMLKDLRVKITYPSTPTWQPIRISGANSATEQKQIILEDCFIETSHAIEIFNIVTGVSTDTESIIQFRGVNDFKNDKELILSTVTPTVPNFITSRGANIRHNFNKISSNTNLQIYNETSIGQTQPIIKVTTTTLTLTNLHNGALLLIKNNCTITVPLNLIEYFSCSFKTFGFTVSIVAAASVTVNSVDGYILPQNCMGYMFNENIANTYELEGEFVL